jgi:hypothetical protein
MRTDTLRIMCKWVVGLALLNFSAFWIAAVYLGGDAVNGKTDNGHFFLMSHGRYTEVSADLFTYSKWHAYSLWLTHPLAFVAAYWLVRNKGASNA